jgi:hypothetical protein
LGQLGDPGFLQSARVLVVDLGDAGVELEAGLGDQPVTLALVPEQAFVFDQQAQALVECQAFVGAE